MYASSKPVKIYKRTSVQCILAMVTEAQVTHHKSTVARVRLKPKTSFNCLQRHERHGDIAFSQAV